MGHQLHREQAVGVQAGGPGRGPRCDQRRDTLTQCGEEPDPGQGASRPAHRQGLGAPAGLAPQAASAAAGHVCLPPPWQLSEKAALPWHPEQGQWWWPAGLGPSPSFCPVCHLAELPQVPRDTLPHSFGPGPSRPLGLEALPCLPHPQPQALLPAPTLPPASPPGLCQAPVAAALPCLQPTERAPQGGTGAALGRARGAEVAAAF